MLGGNAMQRTLTALTLALMVGAAACDRASNRSADTALNTDLSLAAQQRGYQPLDSLSSAERAAAAGAPLAATPRTAARTRVSNGDVSRPRRTTSSGTRAASSGSTSSAPAQSQGETVVKHTKRDAAIGAAAGAVIGATTSRDKVKGGLIGAAVGGIIGGVIGNNVDKSKKKVP